MNAQDWVDFSYSYAPPSQFVDTIEEAEECIRYGDYWDFEEIEVYDDEIGCVAVSRPILAKPFDKNIYINKDNYCDSYFVNRPRDIMDILFWWLS